MIKERWWKKGWTYRVASAIAVTLVLIGCGGGGNSGAPNTEDEHPAPAMHHLSATVQGLAAGEQLTLLNNGTDPLLVNADGAYTFSTPVADGGSFSVTVGTQPEGQTCSIASGNAQGSGVVTDVDDIVIVCSIEAYAVGGSVSGLTPGERVTLMNNGADPLTLDADGAFTFPTPLARGASYSVTVSAQPRGQTCSVSGESGVGAGVVAKVAGVTIVCSTNTYTIGGTMDGLAPGARVTLFDNGADPLALDADGPFTFAMPIAYNASYAVTVSSEPLGQTCSVAGGAGASVSANVTTAHVVCSTNTFSVGGTVAGLAPGDRVTLLNNGADPLTIGANGAFSFDKPVAYNGSYAVTVSAQPSDKNCAVSKGTATNVTGAMNEIRIECFATFAYAVSPTTQTLYQFSIKADGTLVPLAQPTLALGDTSIWSMTAHPIGNAVYLVDWGGSILQYLVSVDGTLNLGSKVMTGNLTSPVSAAIASSGKFAYVANGSSSIVSQFTLDSAGKFAPMANANVWVEPQASVYSVGVHPTGKYVYAAGTAFGKIYQFSVGLDGALTPMTSDSVAASRNPSGVFVEPSGKYVYVTDSLENAIYQYKVGEDGGLQPLSPSKVQTPSGNGCVLAIAPAGNYAYAACPTSSQVAQFAISEDGALRPMTSATVDVGGGTSWVTVEPSGRYAYVLVDLGGGQDEIHGFSIGSDGALTQSSTLSFPMGTQLKALITVAPKVALEGSN